MNQVASVPSNKKYESDSSFTDSGSYCQVCYSSTHKTSKCHHFKEDATSSRPETKITRPALGWKGITVERRRILPVTTFYPLPPLSRQCSQRSTNKKYIKALNTQYVPRHGIRSNCSYSTTTTSRSAHVAPSSKPTPTTPALS